MIPGVGPISNSGQMPIDMGATATSGSGDSHNSTGFTGGVLNFGGSGPNWSLIAVVGAAAVVAIFVLRK